ncbi:MAG: hypothetical protein IPH32_15630 [Bacteroidetes bacterium]|nr:hypothetical protein [Bacteroidota bacterium]
MLPEPGIERRNWNSISGATNPSSVTTAAIYTTLNGQYNQACDYVSPNKYLNIWVTDVAHAVGFYWICYIPPFIWIDWSLAAGTATTDGL